MLITGHQTFFLQKAASMTSTSSSKFRIIELTFHSDRPIHVFLFATIPDSYFLGGASTKEADE